MSLPESVAKEFQYLKEKSDKGALDSNNAIFKKLDAQARNLPELRRALGTLRVNYV